MPDHPSAISGAFRRPFPEQVAFFRQKMGRLVPTRRWDDLIGAAHDQAFMVAGAQKADLLADLAAAVDRAIADGTGLDAFQREFEAAVERHDWHGWTGEETKGGRAWRVRTIYRTNMRTSYAAGRLAQLRASNFPLWHYVHGGSRDPRPEHLLVFNGLALPPEHPFWETHYPPSDWGCSCYVIGARSARAVRRQGGDPDKQLPADWDQRLPATGEPAGIGRGWGYAPGRSVVATVQALSDKAEQLPPQLASALLQDWAREPFQRWAAEPEGEWPLVRVPEADAAAIGAKRVIAQLSADTMRKQARRHPELSWSDYSLAQEVVSAPTAQTIDRRGALVYVREVTDDRQSGGHVLAVKATRSGDGLFVTSFRRLSRDQVRRDLEVKRLLDARGK